MSTYDDIKAALERNRRKHGSYIDSRLLDAQEDGRIMESFVRYMSPPRLLVENEQGQVLTDGKTRTVKLSQSWAWKFALKWKPESGSIMCYGSEGVGKSSMCRFLLAAWCTAGWPIMDLAATRIERELWQISYRPQMRMAKRCLILLIDDITNARMTPRGIDVLREIIDVRHEDKKPTLITSQVALPELHRKIAETMQDDMYATSLLRRLHPYTEIEFAGESYRVAMGRRTNG